MAQPIPAMMNCPLSKAQRIPYMTNCPESKSSVVVIGPEFLTLRPFVLNITKTEKPREYGIVTDVQGKHLFSLKDRVLFYASDKPLVSIQKHKFSGLRGWLVFRGDSTHLKDLLFSVGRNPIAQSELYVYLANTETKKDVPDFKTVPDFKVEGSWNSGTITRLDLDDIIAVIREQEKQTVIDSCQVTVYPNVDYAFIATLVLIMHEDRNGGD